MTNSSSEEFGIVASEKLLQRRGSSFFQGVNSLNQAEDSWRHDQKVAGRGWARIPVRVGRSTRNKDSGAGGGLDVVAANLDDQSAFEYIPGFVVGVMEVARCDQPGRIWGATCVAPLGDYEGVVGGAQNISG